MQAISIIILIIIYSISVLGFLYVFSDIMGLSTPVRELSVFLSLFGVGLGFIFYGLSCLKTQIKNYIVFSIMGIILLIVLITYFFYGLLVLADLMLLFVKIGFFLGMCSVPIVGVFAILKKQKNSIYSSTFGILFLFFFTLFLSRFMPVFSVPFYTSDEMPQLLFFFILILMYIELGVNQIYFNSVIRKMSPTIHIDEVMFTRFNRIFNRYVYQVPTALILVYFISVIFFWNSDFLIAEELIGVKLTSGFGIFLLIIFSIAGSFLFWFLIPREKTKIA